MSGSLSDVTNKEPLALRPHLLSGRLEGRPVEPTFGIIKSVLGFRQFLRGLQSVQHEWALVCIGWNLKRLHRLQIAI